MALGLLGPRAPRRRKAVLGSWIHIVAPASGGRVASGRRKMARCENAGCEGTVKAYCVGERVVADWRGREGSRRANMVLCGVG